ncbi:ABC transporter permease [Vibrio sp. 1-Bac 57]
MAKRDLALRYKGSVMGMLWSFVNPLLMLGIYTFVFQHVFKAKWGVEVANPIGYAVILFSGLVLHMWFAEVLTRAVSLISSNANFVKKVVFPLEVLPWVVLIASCIQFLAALIVLFAFMLFEGAEIGPQILLFPLAIFPFSIMLIGCAYFFAALGLFIKDLEQFIQSFVTILLFTSTIFFSLQNVPEIIRPFIKINPLTIPVEAFRDFVLFDGLSAVSDLFVFTFLSFVFACFSYYMFKKLRPLFPDVL